MKDYFDVVAGILINSQNQVLLARHTSSDLYNDLWEFPGGKVEIDEKSFDALSRELKEELGIEMINASQFMKVQYKYEDKNISIKFFIIRNWHKEPLSLEGQELIWVSLCSLDEYEFLPANTSVVKALKNEFLYKIRKNQHIVS